MTLLGLVGVGRIGAFHARTLHGLPDVEVVVADAQSGRAEQLAATLGLRWRRTSDRCCAWTRTRWSSRPPPAATPS